LVDASLILGFNNYDRLKLLLGGKYIRFSSITPEQIKEIRRLEKENKIFRQIIAEKELEIQLKR